MRLLITEVERIDDHMDVGAVLSARLGLRDVEHLDTVAVDVHLAEDLRSAVKVWVVPDKTVPEDDAAESEEDEAGKEAGTDDDGDDE